MYMTEKMSLFIQGPFYLSSHPSVKGYFAFLHLYSFVELKSTLEPYVKNISLKKKSYLHPNLKLIWIWQICIFSTCLVMAWKL